MNITNRLGVIRGNLVINVPSDFSTIDNALNFLKDKIIVGTVKIKVADGSYNFGNNSLNLSGFKNLTLEGNPTNPENVVLNFNYDGIQIFENTNLHIEGFKVIAVNNAIALSSSAYITCYRCIATGNIGFLADSNAVLYCYQTTALNCTLGAKAGNGAFIRVNNTMTFTNCTTRYSPYPVGTMGNNGGYVID